MANRKDREDGFGSSEAGKKGGRARAKKLTPEERAEIARKAAASRWATKEEGDLPKALCGGKEPLRLGKLEIPCYVLEDGVFDRDEDRRVITASGLQQAIGMTASGGSPRLAAFAASIAPNSAASKDLASRLESPVEFVLPGGGVAKGYSALLLADFCDVILEARRTGVLTDRYAHIAAAAEVVMRGLANVAIVALIDEATGYQFVRRRLALAEILDKYIDDKLNPWTKTFPDEYYIEVFRILGLDYHDLRPGDGKPSEVGTFTREYVYRRLAPGIVSELERSNPYVVPGRRMYKHHQWLTQEIGHPTLREHLAKFITVLKLSPTRLDFERNVNAVLPLPGDQKFFDEFFKEETKD